MKTTTTQSQRALGRLGEGRPLKHQRIRAKLLAEIAEGSLRPGDALPTEHQLAEIMAVSRSTVRQTLGGMEREGVIRRVRGKGTFVAERTPTRSERQTTALAVAVPDLAGGFCPRLVAGFEQATNLAGRAALVCSTGDEVDRQANCLMRLIDQCVGGLALSPSSRGPTPAYQIRLVQAAGIPVVLLQHPIAGVAVPCVQFPGAEAGKLAGQVLAEFGHRRVLVLAPQHTTITAGLEAGLRSTLEHVALRAPDPPIAYNPLGALTADAGTRYEQYIEHTLPVLFQSDDRPTALVVAGLWAAEATYLIALRIGLRIPDQLSLLYVDGARREGALARRLAAVVADEAELGRLAVQCLLEPGANQRLLLDDRLLSVPPGFLSGGTLGPAPAA